MLSLRCNLATRAMTAIASRSSGMVIAVRGSCFLLLFVFFFQAEDGIRDRNVTGVQTCALPIFSGLKARPVASGRVAPSRGLEFGLALSAFSFVLLASAVNPLTALLALVGNLF